MMDSGNPRRPAVDMRDDPTTRRKATAMRRWMIPAIAGASLLAALTMTALAVHPGPAPAAHAPDPGLAYEQALDEAMGWPAPTPTRYATDLATGRQICQMLATGWNEAGVVANLLTWPNEPYTQAQLAVAVHVTHLRLCGQDA